MQQDTYIHISDFTCGLLFMAQVVGTFFIYLKSQRHSLQRMAFWVMLYLLGISSFEFYVFFINNFLGHQMRPVTDMMQMTVVPMALFLLIRLTSTRRLRWWPVVLNLSPYLAALAAYVATGSRAVYLSALTLTCIHGVGIILYGVYAVRRFNRKLKANFSSDSHLSLRWLRLVLAMFILLLITWLTATLHPTELFAAVYNVMCIVIFSSICYFVYRQEDMLEALQQENTACKDSRQEKPAAAEPSQKESDTSVETSGKESASTPPIATYHFEKDFETVFADEQLFLDPQLSIATVARRMGTNRTYVSNYLNQKLHTTFYDYVNTWRVRHSEHLLLTTDWSLDVVAQQAGFNSLSSFRRYFIKENHVTPAEYRRQRN